jgi:DNA-binding MarR family transcriptional regulator
MSAERDRVVESLDDLLREIVQRVVARHPPPHGPDLTFAQGNCMRVIDRLGAPKMSELSAALALHPSTVTGIVDRLIAQGLVEREVDPDDRRVVRVRTSEAGLRGRDEHQRLLRERLGKLVSGLTDEELQRIQSALSLLHTAMVKRGEPEDDPPRCPERDDDAKR